jgi:peptidoglycan/LPS O-acetylase OafA/YrhL
MGNSQPKEEVIIAQTAAAGDNKASASTSGELKFHASVTNVLLGILVCVVIIGSAYAIYRKCKKSHRKWMRQEIALSELQKSARQRGQQA